MMNQWDVSGILMSIQPKWCELIANGKKTVEVRKTIPKCEVPFKVYIYCTHGDALTYPCLNNPKFAIHKMATSHSLHGRKLTKKEREESDYTFANGKVIGEFVCRNIYFLDESALFVGMDEINNSVIEEFSCLSIDELLAYKGNKKEIYGWSISDLVIYEQPKELSEFINYDRCPYGGMTDCNKCWEHHCLKRPPQSWCYVEGGAE